MKKTLILGGSNFIGRTLVEQLLQQGQHELTLLNRNRSNAHLFPEVKRIQGDRNTEEIGTLARGDWDYIIDVSCYYPNSLKRILENTAPSLKKYIFISTCSVYADGGDPMKSEAAPLQICTKADWEDNTWSSYGKRKVACEDLLAASNLNYTILRPALVYGKYDVTNRFYYWLHQVNTYKEIVVANSGTHKFSITYVNDLVNTIVQSLNPDVDRSAYTVTSQPQISIAEIINATAKMLDKSPQLINFTTPELEQANISQWTDLPLWIDNDYSTYDNQKLLNKYSLQITPFQDSLSQTIHYYQSLNWPIPKDGIPRTQQETLIQNQNHQ